MKKLIISLIFVMYSASAFSEGVVGVGVGETTNLSLVTTLVELPSKSKIIEYYGTAIIVVRDTDVRHKPVEIGYFVDQTNIIYMEKNSKIVLLGKNDTKIKLKTAQNAETFTFKVRK